MASGVAGILCDVSTGSQRKDHIHGIGAKSRGQWPGLGAVELLLTTIVIAIAGGRAAGEGSGSCGLRFRVSCLMPFLGHNHDRTSLGPSRWA